MSKPSGVYVLSDEEKQKFSNWINERLRDAVCPICKHDKWQLIENIAALPCGSKTGFDMRGHFPLLIAICEKCAYVMPFSAVQVGIVERDTSEAEVANGK